MLVPCPPLCPLEPKDPCALRLCEHAQTSSPQHPGTSRAPSLASQSCSPSPVSSQRGPGCGGEKDAGWPGTPGPSGLSSGHPAVGTAGPTQPPGHVLTQRARLTRFSAKRKRQALLFSPTIHCSSLGLKNSHTF